MKKRVALVLSTLLAVSVLTTNQPANAWSFKFQCPWHKKAAPAVTAPAVVAPQVQAPAAAPQVTPVSDVKKVVTPTAPAVKKDIPAVNKAATPAPAVKPSPVADKTATPAPAAKPCPVKTCPMKK